VDGIQTPFAGIEVTLAVVPLRAVESDVDLGGHGTVSASDGVAPTFHDPVQIGAGHNTTGSPVLLEFRASFSEFIHPTVADPTIEFTEAGGDPSLVLDPGDGTWQWDNGRASGFFRFTLQPGDDASDDQYRILLNDLADMSGNTVSGQTASSWTTINAWGSFFDFEGSDQGWTKVGPGWERGAPIIGPMGAYSGVSCWGTSLSTNYGNNWNTTLTSPVLEVPAISAELRFWTWFDLYYYDVIRVLIDDGLSPTMVASYDSYDYGEVWTQRVIALDSWAGQDVQVQFEFTTNSYDSTVGFFLDDVEVISTFP
jgi:hypothetical protein